MNVFKIIFSDPTSFVRMIEEIWQTPAALHVLNFPREPDTEIVPKDTMPRNKLK